ncbi:MAG TPA: hypothetical protein VMW80_09680 [Candidatus Dormibacteraeota bacterium]|nr:hypothetical protein [Candidatus Dormibacteraeota bacterium]
MADDLAQDQAKWDRWLLTAMADILRAGLSRQDTEELLSEAMGVAGIAPGLQLAAMREYRASIETLAKLTGAIDERPTVSVNVLAIPEITHMISVLLAALQPYPEAKIAAADALNAVSVREVTA